MSEEVVSPHIEIPSDKEVEAPIEFLVHRKEDLQYFSFHDEDYSITKLSFPVNGSYDEIMWSHSGDYCLLKNSSKLDVVNMKTQKLAYTLNIERISALYISPLDTFILVWNKFNSTDDNLRVYYLVTGELHCSYIQKVFSKQKWPSIQWTLDESIAIQQTTDKIFVLNGKDLTLSSSATISIKSNDYISLSPTSADASILVYTPVSASSPSHLCFYSRANNYMRSNHLFSENRSTFLETSWCPSGNYCIALLKNDVDRTGSSYYGTCTPVYINIQKQLVISLSKPRMPIFACSWNPKGDKFIAIYDSRPMQAYIYNADNSLHFQIPDGIYNDISWSPHSRYVALTGFGNLSGDIQVYDIYKKKLLGRCCYKSTSSLIWGCSSKYFYIYTSYNRMKVDNKYTILKYNCKELFTSNENCLYDISGRPAPLELHPIRPPSPRGKKETKDEELNKEKKKAVYIPPNMRNAMKKGIPGLTQK